MNAEKEALLNFVRSAFEKNGNVTHAVKQSNEDKMDFAVEEIASDTSDSVQATSTQNPYGFDYYKEANWWDTKHFGSYDNLTRISENILYIVSVEQPIHMDLLYKRLGSSFTAGKATENVKIAIDAAIARKLKGSVVVDKDRFVRLLPLTPISVRIPQAYATPRPMEFIHTEEVALAMVKIINNSFGITKEDLASECAGVFGFERKGAKIKAKTEAAIRYLVDSGKVKIIDGKVQLTGE